MLNKKLKRAMCGLVASLCVAGCTVPVFAQTVDFNITVPGDILSKRAEKADTEQRFYVTGTSFNKSGILYCISINRNTSSIKSNMASISPNKLSSNASYRTYAPSKQYYYMTTSASASGLHVTGRYTP
ncbi:MAG: hypothetical protein Q4D16_14170 [Eubacteriales bacterium]|nr:hypothetical protein [Eubacteriales bacterium]